MNQENEKDQEIEKLLEKKARIEKKFFVSGIFMVILWIAQKITEYCADNYYENAAGFFLAIGFFLIPIFLYLIIRIQLINIKIQSIACKK